MNAKETAALAEQSRRDIKQNQIHKLRASIKQAATEGGRRVKVYYAETINSLDAPEVSAQLRTEGYTVDEYNRYFIVRW